MQIFTEKQLESFIKDNELLKYYCSKQHIKTAGGEKTIQTKDSEHYVSLFSKIYVCSFFCDKSKSNYVLILHKYSEDQFNKCFESEIVYNRKQKLIKINKL